MSQSLEQFARSFPTIAKQALGGLSKAIVVAHQKEAAKVARRKATEVKDKGELLRSIKERPGRITADAEHAGIIDRGRKRGLTPRGQKRVRVSRVKGKRAKVNRKAPMLGSKKAPKGISRPTAKEVVAKSAELSRAALAEFEREMTKP